MQARHESGNLILESNTSSNSRSEEKDAQASPMVGSPLDCKQIVASPSCQNTTDSHNNSVSLVPQYGSPARTVAGDHFHHHHYHHNYVDPQMSLLSDDEEMTLDPTTPSSTISSAASAATHLNSFLGMDVNNAHQTDYDDRSKCGNQKDYRLEKVKSKQVLGSPVDRDTEVDKRRSSISNHSAPQLTRKNSNKTLRSFCVASFSDELAAHPNHVKVNNENRLNCATAPQGSPTHGLDLGSCQSDDNGDSSDCDEDAYLTPRVVSRSKELLGAGSFGHVYKAIDINSNRLIAVKEVVLLPPPVQQHGKRDPQASQNHFKKLQTLQREIKLMQQLDHPNIVRYLGSHRSENALNIYMEYVAGGTISSLLKTFGPMRLDVASRFTRHILLGLGYLHSRSIIHRDLKGDNLFVDADGTLKVGDFGTAKELSLDMSQQMAHSVAGTPYFMSPEVIKNKGHGMATDIWSLGCCVIQMLCGKPPFYQYDNPFTVMFQVSKGSDALFSNIEGDLMEAMSRQKDEHCKDENDEISAEHKKNMDDALAFIKLCCASDPQSRPTCDELLQHPWITTVQNPPMRRKRSFKKNSPLQEQKRSAAFTAATSINIGDLNQAHQAAASKITETQPGPTDGHLSIHSAACDVSACDVSPLDASPSVTAQSTGKSPSNSSAPSLFNDGVVSNETLRRIATHAVVALEGIGCAVSSDGRMNVRLHSGGKESAENSTAQSSVTVSSVSLEPTDDAHCFTQPSHQCLSSLPLQSHICATLANPNVGSPTTQNEPDHYDEERNRSVSEASVPCHSVPTERQCAAPQDRQPSHPLPAFSLRDTDTHHEDEPVCGQNISSSSPKSSSESEGMSGMSSLYRLAKNEEPGRNQDKKRTSNVVHVDLLAEHATGGVLASPKPPNVPSSPSVHRRNSFRMNCVSAMQASNDEDVTENDASVQHEGNGSTSDEAKDYNSPTALWSLDCFSTTAGRASRTQLPHFSGSDLLTESIGSAASVADSCKKAAPSAHSVSSSNDALSSRRNSFVSVRVVQRIRRNSLMDSHDRSTESSQNSHVCNIDATDSAAPDSFNRGTIFMGRQRAISAGPMHTNSGPPQAPPEVQNYERRRPNTIAVVRQVKTNEQKIHLIPLPPLQPPVSRSRGHQSNAPVNQEQLSAQGPNGSAQKHDNDQNAESSGELSDWDF